ncbi:MULTISPECIES: hypothetical protein [unclassified Pseudomonas]|jgi:hypothetical protein|uniref:hypothetical protein n=1 Tax=unclassified Pseudomonas TaxID=196821 RepID=UPI000C880D5B|nr:MULTISPECIES: hypothetical protein [unclassified Pseudomonas]PNA96550.1 hypothetical protein C1X74_16385 [Pseudomonas sp. GW460-5]PNB58259.1 hypothetical protein C1X73_14325 [Pseudomonas sp. FW305-130]
MSSDLNEEKWDVAEQIALEAGLLGRCECGYPIDQQVSYRTKAYALASSRFASGDLQLFKNQKDVTDLIDKVVDDAFFDCSVCNA